MNENSRDGRDPKSPGLTARAGEINWEEVRQRIAVSGAGLASMDEGAPEVLEQIWTRRAARLAQTEIREDEGEQVEMVLLRLGREVYGLDATWVFDIRPAERITRVPRVPEWVMGVVNLRGRILSVLDLQRFLGLPGRERHKDDPVKLYLIVVETPPAPGKPSMELALLVDEVLAVTSLPLREIQDAAGAVLGIHPEYVRGVFVSHQYAGGDDSASLVVVLDLAALLSDKQLLVHEEIV
jgi:purine-binding chemotaxis protein CheW